MVSASLPASTFLPSVPALVSLDNGPQPGNQISPLFLTLCLVMTFITAMEIQRRHLENYLQNKVLDSKFWARGNLSRVNVDTFLSSGPATGFSQGIISTHRKAEAVASFPSCALLTKRGESAQHLPLCLAIRNEVSLVDIKYN